MYIYIYIHIHTHTHIYIHIHMYPINIPMIFSTCCRTSFVNAAKKQRSQWSWMPGSSSPSSPNESLGRNAPMLGRLPGLLTPYDDTGDHIRVIDDLQNEEISIVIVSVIGLVLLRANPPVRPHNFLGILKEYKFRSPLNFTFKWEDQQGY